MGILPIVVVVMVAVFNAQPTEGQYYCNGRAAITLQWGGCNGTEAVCSYLMKAITQTYNWWNTTNNTAGNSVGVAVHKAACECSTCTNYTSSTSSTTTAMTRTTSTTGSSSAKPTTTSTMGSTTTTRTSTTTTTSPPAVPPTNCSAIIFGNGYYPGNNITSSIDYDVGYKIDDFPLAGSACSTPYSERLYFPGINTPQSIYWGTGKVPSPFVPDDDSPYSLYYGCDGNFYGTIAQPTACLCSPNGSCYYFNDTRASYDLEFYSWCYNGACVMYMGACAGVSGFYDVATGVMVTNCSAINNGGPLEDCYPGSTNCSYLPVAYFACGPCPSATLELDCPGAIDLVCAGAPSLDNDKSVPLVMARPALGENFPNITGTTLLGTCNNCSSPNTTQYYYSSSSSGQFACMNGTNPTQVDWTGLCMCDQFGGCYQFRPLPDGSATLNGVLSLEAVADYSGLEITISCQTTNANVVVEDEKGNAVFACDGESLQFELYIFSLRCSGRCPTNQPLEIYCPGPYVPA